PPAEVPYVHPLYRPLAAAPKLLERPEPANLETRATLFLTIRLDPTGKVLEGLAVEPPLAVLGATAQALLPRWRFSPAKRAGGSVSTWATYGIELAVELEKAAFSAFTLVPIRKNDPMQKIGHDFSGEQWLTRFPREITPAEPGSFSIEDVDILPAPDKTSWSYSSARVKSRITALVEVSETGAVKRIVPTGQTEPLVLSWLRQSTPRWKLSPALEKANPVSCWMALDATLDYEVNAAKEKGKRLLKKNLRAPAA
ncbi:MAG: hypothetical protein ABIT01_01375, partial [Thermoanaerobaculia bacterium]